MGALLLLDSCEATTAAVAEVVAKRPEWALRVTRRLDEALAQLESAAADLLMVGAHADVPGTEVLAAVRELHPLVPVLFIYAEDDETVLVQVLALGAASYVPRGRIGSDLVTSIDRLLAIAGRSDRRQVLPLLQRSYFKLRIPADRDIPAVVVRYLRDWALETGACTDAGAFQLAVALDEALTNALVHGSLEVSSEIRDTDPDGFQAQIETRLGEEPYASRHVEVEATFDDDHLQVVVRDEGPGFKPEELPDPTAPENRFRLHGRGVMLMRSFMDGVEYNATGNEVTLTKRCDTTDE